MHLLAQNVRFSLAFSTEYLTIDSLKASLLTSGFQLITQVQFRFLETKNNQPKLNLLLTDNFEM